MINSFTKSWLHLFLLAFPFLLVSQTNSEIESLSGDMSAREVYDIVKKWNSRKVESRSFKTHQLDSLYYHSTVNLIPFTLTGKDVFQYSDSLEIVKVYNDPRNWTPLTFRKYFFDPKTKKLDRLSLHAPWDGSDIQLDTLSPYRVMNYFYNGNGLLSSTKSRNIENGSIESYDTEFYLFYDNSELLSKTMLFRKNNADSLVLSGEVFYYHDSLNRLESITQYLRGIALDSIVYYYNQNDHIDLKEEYRGASSELLHMRHFYKYLPDGSLDVITKQEYLRDENSPLDEFIEELYHYQTGGDPRSIDNYIVQEGGDRFFWLWLWSCS